ncbi:MAG: hypothetical protein ACI9FB_002258 [Candidatus Azotimanducaceae bacterium]|jgi:hypothetical protein
MPRAYYLVEFVFYVKRLHHRVLAYQTFGMLYVSFRPVALRFSSIGIIKRVLLRSSLKIEKLNKPQRKRLIG